MEKVLEFIKANQALVGLALIVAALILAGRGGQQSQVVNINQGRPEAEEAHARTPRDFANPMLP